jgi:hypothetical protein
MKRPWVLLLLGVVIIASVGFPENHSVPAEPEKAVLAWLEEIRKAAQALDADQVFSFVLENHKGALVQTASCC